MGEGQVFGVDREWQAADYGLQQNYITVHDLATGNIQVSDSFDGGYVYKSNRPAINFNQVPSAVNNNELGNVVVNQNTHKIYTIFIAPQPNDVNGPLDTVYEAVGNPCAVRCNPGEPLGRISWTNHMIYHDPSGTSLAHIFPVTAVDAGGNVYATWSTTTQVFLTHSTAAATKWSTPIALDNDAMEFYYGEFDPSSNQLKSSNPTTGSINGNTISVNVPLSGVGNPTIPVATDATAGVNDPYGLTISGEGVLGSGLVFVQPDDRAPNSGGGSDWAVC